MAAKETGPFRTKEEADMARKLNFQFPKSKQQASLPDTHTYVVGYFNPNPWPINIMVSELGGMSVVLQQKGHYVLSADGKKINDPILEQHVGAHGLAREMSKAKVPINYIPRPSQNPNAASYSPVLEAEGFTRGPNGNMVPLLKPAAKIIPRNETQPQLPPPGSNPVIGMSRQMAEDLRLIKPTRTPPESTIKDTDGVPISGDKVPTIEYATDMTPGEAKRLQAGGAPKASPPPLPVEATELHPDMTQAETPEQATTLAALKNSGSVDLLGVTDVGKLRPKLDDVALAPVVETEVEPESEPEVPGAVIGAPTTPLPGVRGGAPVPTAKEEVELKFICSVDQKGFQFRSGLERHARLKYPAQYDEIMQPYPKA